jgi:hypothetical protein
MEAHNQEYCIYNVNIPIMDLSVQIHYNGS